MCHDIYQPGKRYQPNKRRREEGMHKKVVYILRGVPGTGKTTLAEKIEKAYQECGWDISKINRDKEREDLIKTIRFKKIFEKELNYQESFSNVTANTLVRDEYYKHLRQLVNHLRFTMCRKSLLIIDSTHTKIADLITTLDLFKDFPPIYDLNVYIVTKRTIHGNIHNVPEPVMKNFKKELEESDEWLNKTYPKKEKVTLL